MDPTSTTTAGSRSKKLLLLLLPRLLRHVLHHLLSLLPCRRLFSFVALKDVHLSLSFLLSDLTPVFLPLPNYDSTLHFWIPNSNKSNSKIKKKPALLLLHGFGANARWQFEKQIPSLSRSFDLYVPDLLFFGASATSSPDRSVELQAKCLVESMSRLGIRKYSVAGISYGGFVAYLVAEMAGEGTVERVVVMTAGICAGEEERRALVEKEGRDVCEVLLPRRPEDLMELMRRSMYRPPRWMPDFLLRDFIEIMYKDRRKERVELLKDLVSKGAGVNPLPVLKQETLILWGDQDNVFPISLAYKLKRYLGPKARLEVLKDAGHALQLEKPDLVNHMIEWFVSEPYKSKST